MTNAFEHWTLENKHALRALYAEFLKETGATFEAWKTGKVASFGQFQKTMWENRKRS